MKEILTIEEANNIGVFISVQPRYLMETVLKNQPEKLRAIDENKVILVEGVGYCICSVYLPASSKTPVSKPSFRHFWDK